MLPVTAIADDATLHAAQNSSASYEYAEQGEALQVSVDESAASLVDDEDEVLESEEGLVLEAHEVEGLFGSEGVANETSNIEQADDTTLSEAVELDSAANTSEMFRLYNPNSGEHFYTASVAERAALVGRGWKYEGVAWVAPWSSSTPVYRLYNPNAGDHHYTTSTTERDTLRKKGWTYEGIGWYSDDSKGVVLHRLYNPNARAGAHHYTSNTSERDKLSQLGWRKEGIGWYGATPTGTNGFVSGVPTGLYQGSYGSDGFMGSGTMLVSLNPDPTFAYEASGGGGTTKGTGTFRVVSLSSPELPVYFVSLHKGTQAALILSYSTGNGQEYFSYHVDGSRRGTRGPRLLLSAPGSSGTLYLTY